MFGGGSVEGDGGLWMVKQGHRVEGLTVATLRDVRLFRCKRFEGILFSEWKDRNGTKKRCVFSSPFLLFWKFIQRRSKEQKSINQQRENRGKNIRFSMLKSYVI